MGKPPRIRDVDAKLNRARADHGAGRLAAASRAYDGILRDSPDRTDVLHLRGVLARQTGNANHALFLLRRAVNMQGDVPAYLYSLGLVLAETGAFAEAAIAFRRTLAQDGAHPDALTSLAMARYGQGKVDEAEERLHRALERNPDDVRALSALGCIAFEARDFVTAAMAMGRAAARDPDYAFGRACHLGDSYFACADLDALDARLAAIAPVSGAFPTGGGEALVSIACDRSYYRRFGRSLIESIDRNAPGRAVHLHLMNPGPGLTDEVAALADGLENTALSWSWETAPAVDARYYAAMRFVRLYQLFAACGRDVLSLDADSLVLAGLDSVAGLAAKADATVILRPERCELHQKVFAATVLVRQTAGGRRLLGRIASYILASMATDAPVPYLDQCAFYITMGMLEFNGEPVAVSALTRPFGDQAFDEASPIWTASGRREFRRTLADEPPNYI